MLSLRRPEQLSNITQADLQTDRISILNKAGFTKPEILNAIVFNSSLIYILSCLKQHVKNMTTHSFEEKKISSCTYFSTLALVLRILYLMY